MRIKIIKEQAYDFILKKILTVEYPLGSRTNITSFPQEPDMGNRSVQETLKQRMPAQFGYYKPVWDMRPRGASNPGKAACGGKPATAVPGAKKDHD